MGVEVLPKFDEGGRYSSCYHIVIIKMMKLIINKYIKFRNNYVITNNKMQIKNQGLELPEFLAAFMFSILEKLTTPDDLDTQLGTHL